MDTVLRGLEVILHIRMLQGTIREAHSSYAPHPIPSETVSGKVCFFDPDPYQFESLDPDPEQFGSQDPDMKQYESPDPDPEQFGSLDPDLFLFMLLGSLTNSGKLIFVFLIQWRRSSQVTSSEEIRSRAQKQRGEISENDRQVNLRSPFNQ